MTQLSFLFKTLHQAVFNTVASSKRSFSDLTIRSSLTYKFGLKKSVTNPLLPTVCCLLRNGEYWLPSFLDHHRKMGIRDFFFLDNGSNDATLDMLSREKDVGVYTSDISFKDFNPHLRRALANKVCPKGWVLALDIDELFNYPYSEKVTLEQLTGYLETHRFNCMSTHLLDMFSEKAINELQKDDNDLKKVFTLYSLDEVHTDHYEKFLENLGELSGKSLQLPNNNWKAYYDGIRYKKLNLKVWLTKHALYKVNSKITPFIHPHAHKGMVIGDISGVLLHYKFIPTFKQKVSNALEEKQYWNNSFDYKMYGKNMHTLESQSLADDQAQKLISIHDLVEQSFLTVSNRFKTYFHLL